MGLTSFLAGLPSKLLGGPIEALQQRRGPSWTLSQTPGVLFSNSNESASGQCVDAESALSLSAVFAGVNFLSEIIASLPLDVYRELQDGSKQIATQHPARKALALTPNPWMTGKTARKVMEWNRCLGGKACAEIQWTQGGNIAAYWPIEYWRVEEKYDDSGQLYYWIDKERRVEVEDMLYVPLVTSDGVEGCSFLDYAIESLGLSMSAQECAALFFGNGAHASGILKHTGNPAKEQREEFRKTWEATHGGKNKGRVAVTWGGWEYTPDSGQVTPDNAQLLESRKFTVEEVARWLNLPPFFLGDLTHSRFANAEQQSINLVVFTVNSILCGYEQEYDKKLLTPPSIYSKHNVNALLRGDHKARGEFYKLMSMIGVLSINDILKLEDMNPIGAPGDLRFVQGNMITLEQAKFNADNPGQASATTPAPVGDNTFDSGSSGDNGDNSGQDAGGDQSGLSAMVGATWRRMLSNEANAIRRALKKPNVFPDWMADFYPKHALTLKDALAPATMGIRPSQAAELLAVYVENHCNNGKRALDNLCELHAAKFVPAVESLLAKWETEVPQWTARFMKELEDARNA